MLWLLYRFFVVYLLSTLAYYLWIISRSYRVFKFACAQNGRFLPLVPFIGNIYLFLLTGQKVNMISFGIYVKKLFGFPFNAWFGHKYHYVTDSPDEAKIVLNHPKCLDKAQIYGDIHYIFRNSILLIPGDQWKGRRRYLRSAFNTVMINQFVPTMYQQSCLLLQRLTTKRPEDDHFKFFNVPAFMSFFLTSIGWMKEDIQESELSEFAQLEDKMQDEFVKLLANPIIPVSLWIRSPPGAKLRQYTKEMKRILRTILIKKKHQMANLPEFVDQKTDLTLVELLLNDRYNAIRESDIFEEFTLFAAAATDTTGHTLSFCFTLLGMYPEIEQKVFDEVMAVIGDHDIDSLHLPKLIYTEAVISETMRILPAIPGVGRYCDDDIDLGDKVLPKGANVIISIFHIHRHPDYWEDPLKFDPTRFLPENLHKIVPGSFLPFSDGARNCIGQRMAIVLMKITVANVVRNFRIFSKHKSVKEFKLTSSLSMKTTNHLDLHFVPRRVS